MKQIPDSLALEFHKLEVRQQIIEKFSDNAEFYVGNNAFGDRIILNVSRETGITLQTYQANGWLRITYYDPNGFYAGETFDGRWRMSGDENCETCTKNLP